MAVVMTKDHLSLGEDPAQLQPLLAQGGAGGQWSKASCLDSLVAVIMTQCHVTWGRDWCWRFSSLSTGAGHLSGVDSEEVWSMPGVGRSMGLAEVAGMVFC